MAMLMVEEDRVVNYLNRHEEDGMVEADGYLLV